MYANKEDKKEMKKIFVDIGDVLTGKEAHFAYFERRITPGAVILYAKDGETLFHHVLSHHVLGMLSDELIQSKEYFVVAKDMRMNRKISADNP